ncbi:MAG: hypothetical protein WKF58_19255 [Ilumatobacteraceae bacterium]
MGDFASSVVAPRAADARRCAAAVDSMDLSEHHEQVIVGVEIVDPFRPH